MRANRGKEQFARAKDEIWELRSEYDTLREKYLDAKSRLDDVSTSRDAADGTLTISKDDPQPVEGTREATPPIAAKEVLADEPKRQDETKRQDQPATPTTEVSNVVAKGMAKAAPDQAQAV